MIAVVSVLVGSAGLVIAGLSVQTEGSMRTASALAGNGIKLVATLAPTTLRSGDKINVTDDAINTLPILNNISASNDWALRSLVGPCGGGIYADSLFQGHDSVSNITSATELPLVGPGLVTCPYIHIDHYVFQPRSDVAEFVGTVAGDSNINASTASEFSLSGYYSASASEWIQFPPGLYTLVEGDAWGSLVFLPFTVV